MGVWKNVERDRQIIAMWRESPDISVMAERFSVSHQTIYSVLGRARRAGNCPSRPRNKHSLKTLSNYADNIARAKSVLRRKRIARKFKLSAYSSEELSLIVANSGVPVTKLRAGVPVNWRPSWWRN